MRKSLKIASIAAVVLLALGVFAFVYAGSQSLTASADEQQTITQTFSGWNNCTMPDRMGRMPQMRGNGLQWAEGLSQNATLSTVQGTVISEVKGMLVLDTGSGQIRVLLPKDWTVGTETVGRTELFNGTFASAGQSVTVKVLENDVFSNANFSINVMMGYEAINATNAQAYAVLPFNIQPAS